MITIKQEQVNYVIIDFPFTVVNPYFLIEFVNCFNGNTFTAIFDNLEDDDCSYARIRVTEVGPTGTVNYLTGNIKLSPAGEWTANIYAQTSSTNLDTDLADEFLGTEDVFVKIGDSCEQYALPYETFCSKMASCAAFVSVKDITDLIQTGGDGTLFLADDGTYKAAGGGGGSVTSVFGRTGVVVAVAGDYTTTLVTEGTNLYYTQARFDSAFSVKTTSDLSEGSNLYFTETRVRATVLTGLNVTGSSIAATDSVLQAFGKLQSQINGVLGGAIYQGTWNATTNSPSLSSGTGTKGYYYVVSVAGSTNLDGVTDWKVGDWAIFNGTAWEKVDNTDAVSSVNGYIGAVNLVTGDISESSNLYFTNSRVDSRVSAYTGDVTLSGTAFAIGAGKVTSTMLDSMTSAQFAAVISDETGSGALVFGTSPEFTTSVTTASTTFNVFNTNATIVNFAGAASAALNIGHASGVLSFAPTSITLAASTVITASGTVSTTLRNGAANSVVIDITKSAAATANTLNFVGARILGTYSPSTATSTGSFYGLQVGHTINQGASNANPTGGVHVRPILTNVYGTYASVFIETPVASGGTGTVWGVYQTIAGVYNYFAGNTGVGTTASSSSWLQLAAGTTAISSLNIPSGSAPTSPNNGDIWSDGSDLLIRLGGATYTLDKTAA